MKKYLSICFSLVFILVFTSGCSNKEIETEICYAEQENWAYCETQTDGKEADVFFICPTVFDGSENENNMPLEDEDAKESFLGAINMEKGIYDSSCRVFAPYYRQAGLNVYGLPYEKREPYLQSAYQDVKQAFEYYYEHYNEGRPIVLAGFSQGADISLRLLKDLFDEDELAQKLVACYAIGWNITQEELEKYPHMKFAASETDTGVIISFNSEAENVTDSLIVPKNTKTLAINPLNWKTDGTFADRSWNHGACFTNYSGEIEIEIPELTGAYIDDVRGTLKVTDVTPEEYPPVLELFEDGIYHLYDYQFFYRNLQENVAKRIAAYRAD